MSYINDALRKVQREKGSDYASCSDTIFDGEKRPRTRRSWFPLLIGATAVFFIAVIGIAAWWWLETHRESSPQVAVVQVEPVPAVLPSPAKVGEIAPSGMSPEASAVPDRVSSNATASSVEVQPAPAASDRLPAEDKKEEQDAGIGIGAKKKDISKPAPVNPKALYARALKSHREGRLKEAEALYQEVVKTDPRHVAALNNLGVIWMNRKMYQQAVGSFKKALNVRHDYVDAHYNLACLYARKNDKKQSLNYLKNAIDLNPDVKQWALQDHDLQILTTLPEFNQLVGTEGK